MNTPSEKATLRIEKKASESKTFYNKAKATFDGCSGYYELAEASESYSVWAQLGVASEIDSKLLCELIKKSFENFNSVRTMHGPAPERAMVDAAQRAAYGQQIADLVAIHKACFGDLPESLSLLSVIVKL